jgi:hypothetical protein
MRVHSLTPLITATLLACSDGGVRPRQDLPDAGGPTCGNDRVDTGEQCDGADLGGHSCTTLGFNLGTVSCDAQCRVDTTACVKLCGNGRVDPGEGCDGTAGALTCADWGYKVCTPTCAVDALHCRTDALKASTPIQQARGGPAIVTDLAPVGPGDLVIADPGLAKLNFYRYALSAGFSTASEGIGRRDGVSPAVPIAADLDGDGRIDLAAINTDGTADRYLYVPPGQPLPDGGAPSSSGQYAVEHLLDAPAAGKFCPMAGWIGAATLDGDAISDLAALACPTSATSPTFEGVIIHRGGPTPSPADWVPQAGTISAALADFDGDGAVDLLLGQGDKTLIVRNGPGFAPPSTAMVLDSVPSRIAAGDLDGDGDADVVIGTSGAVKILENTATALAPRSDTPGIDAFAVAVRDLDLDGRPDVVWLTTSQVEILRNLGSFTFARHAGATGPGTPLSLALGDFEGDGDPDLAATALDSPDGTATTTYVLENLVR